MSNRYDAIRIAAAAVREINPGVDLVCGSSDLEDGVWRLAFYTPDNRIAHYYIMDSDVQARAAALRTPEPARATHRSLRLSEKSQRFAAAHNCDVCVDSGAWGPVATVRKNGHVVGHTFRNPFYPLGVDGAFSIRRRPVPEDEDVRSAAKAVSLDDGVDRLVQFAKMRPLLFLPQVPPRVEPNTLSESDLERGVLNARLVNTPLLELVQALRVATEAGWLSYAEAKVMLLGRSE